MPLISSGPSYTRLANAYDLANDGIKTVLEQNLVDFLQWAFLEAGGFTNVAILQPGVQIAHDPSACYPLQKDGVAAGRIWQAPNPDWCYETGITSGWTPTVASGILVNGTSCPTSSTTGAFAHYLDFRMGRVVFDAPIAVSSVVQVAHSYRWVGVHDQDVPWYRTVMLSSYLEEQAEKGTDVLQVLSDYRVQLPLVIVEASMRVRQHGYQLGSDALWTSQDILFHVVAQDKQSRDRIADAITRQQGRTLYLYNTASRRQSGDFPLDWRGSPVTGARMYPALLENPPTGFRWQTAHFMSVTGSDVSEVLPLYRGMVRASVEVVFSGV